MARIIVNDSIHSDLRLTLAARKLGISRDRLVVSLMRVWFLVTEWPSTHVRVGILIAALRCRPERTIAVLVDTGLAFEVEDSGALDIAPLRAFFSDLQES